MDLSGFSETISETYEGRTGLSLGVSKRLFLEQSAFQLVEVYETDSWGNVLLIDGIVMLSERDEFVYHEMLVHTALLAHPNPKRVLIIGGGDGGSAREVCKHPSVKSVDMVEIDETVVRASKAYLPHVGDFSNPKLNLIIDDGIAFLKNITKPYDVIIVDGSDPVGPAEGLFNRSFYEDCFRALSENGIVTAQVDSPWLSRFKTTGAPLFAIHRTLFKVSHPFLSFIPLYPTGMFAMAWASKDIAPVSDETMLRVQSRFSSGAFNLKYYNPEVHRSAFALPEFVREKVYG